jgi:catalase
VAFNSNKPLEYDPAAAVAPPVGLSVDPEDPIVGASTVTERHGSEKAGSGGPPIGANKTIAPLNRVRADASGQRLTSNQGVRIGDNRARSRRRAGPDAARGLHPPREDHAFRS